MTDKLAKIGPYRLIKPLGQGGMGVVYKAYEPVEDRYVALKTIRISGETELDSLRREIRAMARLEHPGIVRILDEGVHEDKPWYAMELLEGMTIREYLLSGSNKADENFKSNQSTDNTISHNGVTPSRWWTIASMNEGKEEPSQQIDSGDDTVKMAAQGKDRMMVSPKVKQRLPLDDIISIAASLCSPLMYLHGEGMVHRDLKPENIFITPERVPVLVDFGLISQFTGEVSRDTIHNVYGSIGTANYMSPEQIRGELVDARSDLYSLGCIMYELLVGHPPFIGVTIQQIVQAHLHQMPQSPKKFREEIPLQLDQIVMKLLEKDARQRFGYADTVASFLTALLPADHKPAIETTSRTYLYRSPFVGQETNLAKLFDAIQQLTLQKGSFFLISGESGVGKTRLMIECANRVSNREMKILAGACSEDSSLPLEGLLVPLQGMADRCREHGQEETERLFGKRGPVLSQYESSLAMLPGQKDFPHPEELPAQAAMVRLFSYLFESIASLAEVVPVLLFIDDLQWADELVLGFLKHVLRRQNLQEIPLCIVGTCRSGIMNQDIADLLAEKPVEQLNVSRLSLDSLGEVVREMLALSEAVPQFIHFLYNRSEGNPFIVAEYLRAAVEQEMLWRDKQGQWQILTEREEEQGIAEQFESLPLPGSVQQTLQSRLSGLSRRALDFVQASAVIGRSVHTSLLETMIGFDHESLLDISDEMIKRHILEKSKNNMFRFVHAQLREVAIAELEPDHLKKLHRSAAESIEDVFSDELETYFPALGSHWEAAGESTNAKDYYLRAGGNAALKYANADAEKHYRAYRKLCKPETEEYVKITYKLASILTVMGRWSEGNDLYNDGLARAQELNNELLIAEGKEFIGKMYKNRGLFKKGLPFFQESLAIFSDHESHFHISSIQGDLGDINVQLGKHQQAMECYRKKIIHAQKINNKNAEHWGVLSIAMLYDDLGDYEKALELYEKARLFFEKIDDKAGLSCTIGNMGLIFSAQGDHQKALECHQKDLHISESIGYLRAISFAYGNCANSLTNLYKHEQAIEYFQKQLSLAEKMGDKQTKSLALGNMGITLKNLGNFEKALECYNQSLAINEKTGYRNSASITQINLGQLAFEQEKYKEAIALFDRSLAIARDLKSKLVILHALIGKAETLFAIKAYDEAKLCNDEGLMLAEEMGISSQIFLGTLLKMKIDHTLGSINGPEQLKTMLAKSTSREEQARLWYELWLLEKTKYNRQHALELYQDLQIETNLYDHKQKFDELSQSFEDEDYV